MKKNFSLMLHMPVEVVAADPRVKANIGKRAVQRGPIVYCTEYADNKTIDLDKLVLTSKNNFSVVEGAGLFEDTKLLQTSVGGKKLTFIPYYAWDNRKPGKMLVWVNYKK